MKMIDLARDYFAKTNTHFLSLLVIALIALFVTYSNLGLTKEFIGDDASVGYHYPGTRLDMVVSMWNPYIFPGKSDTIGTVSLIHISSISALNKLGLSSIFIDRLYYFIFFFLSGMGMYFLSFFICVKLNDAYGNSVRSVSFVGAVFYMLNNFTMIMLSFPPTNYVYSYMLLPWILLIYLKDFHISNKFWRRFIFVVVSILILSGNPSNTIGIIFLLLIYELFFRKSDKLIHSFKKFIPTLLLIFLLSSFIYLPVLGNRSNPYGNVLSMGNRASISFSSAKTSFENLFILRGHHSQDTFVFNEFLMEGGTVIANYILLIIVLTLFLRRKMGKMESFLFIVFLLFLFLAKAEHIPFTKLSRWIYDNVPLFEMYRASYFKFVYYCVFTISILLPISLLKISNEFSRSHLDLARKTFLAGSFLLVLFCAKPFFWGEVARDIHKTIIPNEYNELRQYFENSKMDFSVLSVPQLSSGLVLDWGNENYYGGGHPDMFILGKSVWSNGWFLPKNTTSDQFSFYKNILHRSSIKYILLHKDIPEEYSFNVNMSGTINGQTNLNVLNDQIKADSNFNLILDNKFFRIFEINRGEFNPHWYVPQKSVVSGRNFDEFPRILAQDEWGIRSAVFFENQNVGKENKIERIKSEDVKIPLGLSLEKEEAPVLEFKKINPTKYRVRVHGASGVFPVVFSESYHDGWRAYVARAESQKSKAESDIEKYKILDGNEDDQASKEELQDFFNRGWVTDLGDGKEKEIEHNKWEDNKEKLDYVEKYNIDFVSKNFQGTIQNDNLPSGHFWETWFKKPLDDQNHLMVNGYANSWVVDTTQVCKVESQKSESGESFCVQNPDGSYDFEMVVEFWPQRLFYVGAGISGATLLACLGYLAYDWRKRRKTKIDQNLA